MNRRGFLGSLGALTSLILPYEKTALAAPVMRLGQPPQPISIDELREIMSETTEPVSDGETMYTDIFEMLTAIRAHVDATGEEVLAADNPRRFPGTLGYWSQPTDGSNGRGWSITLPDLAKSLKKMEEQPDPVSSEARWEAFKSAEENSPPAASPAVKAQILRHCFKSQEGRTLLLRLLAPRK